MEILPCFKIFLNNVLEFFAKIALIISRNMDIIICGGFGGGGAELRDHRKIFKTLLKNPLETWNFSKIFMISDRIFYLKHAIFNKKRVA